MNIIRWAKWLMVAFLGLLVAIGLVATGCDESGHGEEVQHHHHTPTMTPTSTPTRRRRRMRACRQVLWAC